MRKLALCILLFPAQALAQEDPIEAPPPQQPAQEEAPPPPKKPSNPLGFRFDGGYGTRELYKLGVTGADLGLGIGPQIGDSAAVWATPRLYIGSTENGLSLWSGRVGAEAEWVLGRFRLGAGLGLFLIGVHRAVRSETLLSYGFDFRAATRFDVVKSDDLAFFIRAALDGSAEIRGGGVFWGPTIGVGVQIDSAKKP